MKLYLITTDGFIDYDNTAGQVIRARSENRARALYGGNLPASVEYLGTAQRGAKEGIVLRDYRAG